MRGERYNNMVGNTDGENTSLTIKEKCNTIKASGSSANLDNRIESALSPVQVTQEKKTPNGCYVTMVFPLVSQPGVQKGIAQLLLSTFERRKKVGDTS